LHQRKLKREEGAHHGRLVLVLILPLFHDVDLVQVLVPLEPARDRNAFRAGQGDCEGSKPTRAPSEKERGLARQFVSLRVEGPGTFGSCIEKGCVVVSKVHNF
jgi:hypothetical protein